MNQCRRELRLEDMDFKDLCDLDKGRFLGKMDGKYVSTIRLNRIFYTLVDRTSRRSGERFKVRIC